MLINYQFLKHKMLPKEINVHFGIINLPHYVSDDWWYDSITVKRDHCGQCGMCGGSCCSCRASTCFPSAATIRNADGKSVKMSELQDGDKVETG